MPLDDGGWFDQHHGVEDLRPNPVKPHPEEPVCGEESNPTFVLPPQDAHLMSKGNELEFQGGAATKAKREQRSEGGKICDHADKGMAGTQKSLGFLHVSKF